MSSPGQTVVSGSGGIKIFSSGRPLQVQRSPEGTGVTSPLSGTVQSSRRREFYCEEIDQRTSVSLHRPLTPREVVDSARLHVFRIFYFVLLVLAATFFCIVSEGDVPLAWILPCVSAISLLSFHRMKL